MAHALLSIVLTCLAFIVEQQIRDELTLVLGVETEIQSLTDTLRSEKSVQGWLERLKDMAYQMDDVLDEWSTAILQLQMEGAENASMSKNKVSSSIPSPCFCFKQVASRRDIALKIKDIKQQPDVIGSERARFNFISKIKALIIAIVGTGGMGKTTLAQLAYNHQEAKAHFDERIWVCVSDPFDPIRVCRAIVETLQKKPCNLHDLEAVQQEIQTCIAGKKFLLVLDDMWTEDYRLWEQLKNTLNYGAVGGSRILVTTCKYNVSKMMGTSYKHPIGEFSPQHAQELFQIAFFGKSREQVEELKEIGEKIADKCKGLPLVIKTLGNLMRLKNKKEEWKNVLNSEVWQLDVFERDLFPALLLTFFEKSREKVEELKEIGGKIADKCKGLPLAIKTLGNLMRLKNNKEELENVLNSEVWQLDEFERDICPALLLSYYDLPPAIKRCFSFCAVFPKDSVIKIDELIRLWMAQNYLNSDASKEMEMVGREYFEYLAARSFFQDFEKDGDDDIIRCKMHDIMHDFAQFLTKNECFIMNVENAEVGRTKTSFQKIRHATLVGQQRYPNFVSTYKMKNLHTLLLKFTFSSSSDEALPNLFQHLTCLRVLNLARNPLIMELPKAVGKLIHLKYLSLSDCHKLRELPETICDLYNLQTLNIRRCFSLVELPQAMGKLINLRHLQNCGTLDLKGLPKGIARLNSLQTLEEFVVSSDGDAECKIGDLRNLTNLRGELEIRGLRKVEDAREVQKAELKNKIHIHHLTLVFDLKEGTKGVAEALHPHPNLKCLCIWGYGDIEWHDWMMRSSLTQLKNLELSHCSGCRCMPPLGELPVLEKLKIKDMESVKHIGGEFLGSSSTIAFPNLKKLTFHNMEEWEKWEIKEEEEEERSIMPCLSYLEIQKCPKLEGPPDHVLQWTPLQEFHHKF
ncbi:hypothetical protein PVL29_011739 [Vitis rotundifolia]|uniref:Uncharacterized protein n=1 Tax=Vitis rotundifolia TaxID=103349 RepID=A0AA38ZPI9_VITRO|nr:hypothetical protein PVL29_011739 [Vitis rotundifolia]